MSKDVNVEQLLDVFTTIDANLRSVWDACKSFTGHLYWHKPRLTLLGPRIEELPAGHPYKPLSFLWLSRLFGRIGNHIERKRALTRPLGLWRGWGGDHPVAQVLGELSGANRLLGLHKKGIQCLEASKSYE